MAAYKHRPEDEIEDLELAEYFNNKFYCCKWCARKYKTVNKFQKHMSDAHPFQTLGGNIRVLKGKDKIYLLTQLDIYIKILLADLNITAENIDTLIAHYLNGVNEVSKTSEAEFIRVSDLLNKSDDKSSFNLKRMVQAHLVFRQRVRESKLLSKISSDITQLEAILIDFQSFLNLGRRWQGDNFCPSLIIDLIWHAAMLDHEQYELLCQKFSGKTLTHCLVENDNKHDVRFAEFEKFFIEKFKRPYLKIDNLIFGSDYNAIYQLLLNVQNDKIQRAILYEENRIKQIKQNEINQIIWEERRIEQLEDREKYRLKYGRYPPVYTDDGKC